MKRLFYFHADATGVSVVHKSDIVLIGGGIIGLVIAWRLCQNGHQVTVLERGQIGREASWAAAGMLAPHCEFDHPDAFFDLCKRSLDTYPDFISDLTGETGQEIDYLTTGTIFPALSDGDQKKLETRFKRQNEAGLPVELLSAKATRRLEPNLSANVHMSLRYPDDHQVESRDVIKALTQAIRQLGGMIYEEVAVKRILTDQSQVTGVQTDSAVWESRTVVNTTGSWARYLDGVPSSVRPPIRPVHGQILSLATGGAWPFRHTIFTSKTYLVPRSNGRLIVGATVEEPGFRKEVTVDGILQLLHGALRLAPSLRAFPLEATWSGLRPAAEDHLPVLGPTSVKGYHLATGHYRNGILLAPITGDLMVDLIENQSIPSLMQPFLLDRFYSTD
jgi:glycine oxidase